MKKTISALLLISLMLSMLTGCGPNYEGWKDVELANCGTIKVPAGWMKCEHNGKVYLTDKPLEEENCTIYFFQSFTVQDSTVFSENIEWIDCLSSEVFSDGAGVGKARLSFDGVIQDVLYFWLPLSDGRDADFFAMDESIDEDTVRKIAKSFEMSW